jgi:transposase-like protein
MKRKRLANPIYQIAAVPHMIANIHPEDFAMTATLTDKQQYWLDHFQQANASGKTLTQYADDTGINIQLLYNWRKKLRSQGLFPAFASSSEPAVHFARVVSSGSETSEPNALVLAAGAVTLRFGSLPDADWLARMIGTLVARA